jgi:hypothetical protein
MEFVPADEVDSHDGLNLAFQRNKAAAPSQSDSGSNHET